MNSYRFLNVDFFASFEEYHQIINHDGKEIAFVGASNSGKSSAINALANKSKLAKVSKKPGKTKLFNFFRLKRGYIVDFPGYGYAKTSKEQKKIWSIELPQYFEKRPNLSFAYLFSDIRHPLKDSDYQMLELLTKNQIEHKIIFTKCDKINTQEIPKILDGQKKKFLQVDFFSIKNKSQILKIASEINELLSN